MVKKITKVIGICILTCFSFYYTDKIIDVAKSKDSIMISIMKEEEKYEIPAVDAIMIDDYIISGISGKKVDVEKSYEKMKKLGEYNENLLVFMNENPKVSLCDNYDKFIIRGNSNKEQVAILINARDISNTKNIINILNENNIPASIYLDKSFIKENYQELEKLNRKNIVFSNGGCNNNYEELCIKETNMLLKTFENYDDKFCYVTADDYDILENCKNNYMYTIKPLITDNVNPYVTIKNNLQTGNIYLLNDNIYTKKELSAILKYINQKGFEITTISDLLDEK